MSITNRIGIIIIGLALSLVSGMAAAEVVAVVSPSNPVTTLSRNQVADIFLGKTNSFPDGKQAVPVDQAEGSAVRKEFYLKFAGKSPAQLKAHWSKIIFTGRGQPPPEVSSDIEEKELIVKNPHAIGYIERKQVDGSVKALLTQ